MCLSLNSDLDLETRSEEWCIVEKIEKCIFCSKVLGTALLYKYSYELRIEFWSFSLLPLHYIYLVYAVFGGFWHKVLLPVKKLHPLQLSKL